MATKKKATKKKVTKSALAPGAKVKEAVVLRKRVRAAQAKEEIARRGHNSLKKAAKAAQSELDSFLDDCETGQARLFA